MKLDELCTYPCRGVLHTPRNVPRQRFGYKTGQVFGCIPIGKGEIGCVFGVFGWGNMKPAGFFTYPCKAQNHTPPNVLRQGFAPKIGCVFDVFRCGNMKPAKFCMYPCRGVLHTPQNDPRRRFGSKIGPVLGISLLGRVKSGAFLVYPCVEI